MVNLIINCTYIRKNFGFLCRETTGNFISDLVIYPLNIHLQTQVVNFADGTGRKGEFLESCLFWIELVFYL